MDSRSKMSLFWKEVGSLPVIQAAGDVYSSSKKSSTILGTGLAVVEYSLGSLVDRFCSQSTIAARVDNLAGEGVSRLKEKYPSLHQSPDEIKDRTYRGVRTSVRHVMKTMPGRLLIGGLDWVIDRGEGLLTTLKPRDKSPVKRKSTRASQGKQVPHVEHTYASEDSGACEAEVEGKHAHKSQQTPHTQLHEYEEDGLLMRAYKLGVVKPIDTVIRTLKYIRRYVAGKRRRTPRDKLSPEKKDEIKSRRKVSPRKKMATGLFGQLKQRTYGLLGYRYTKNINICSGADSAGSGDVEKKRKHEEILTDDASASEDDMENFDFDNYESEEDPDYEPTNSEGSEDSSISEELDEESDIEAEPVETRTFSGVQLKEKTSANDATIQKPASLEAAGKPEVACSPSKTDATT